MPPPGGQVGNFLTQVRDAEGALYFHSEVPLLPIFLSGSSKRQFGKEVSLLYSTYLQTTQFPPETLAHQPATGVTRKWITL